MVKVTVTSPPKPSAEPVNVSLLAAPVVVSAAVVSAAVVSAACVAGAAVWFPPQAVKDAPRHTQRVAAANFFMVVLPVLHCVLLNFWQNCLALTL